MNNKIIAFVCFTLCAAGLKAAPPMHNEPRTFSPLKDAAHPHFEENAPEGCKDAVPHFAIFGKEGSFYLGIGGTVKVTAGEDWGDPLSNPNSFITSELTQAAPGDNTKFNLSAQQSSLFVNFVGLPDSKNKISAFVGINFLNNYVPVLQNAYVKWRGLKAGYDYTAFSDNGALPPSIDYEGPNAATSVSVPTVSYTYTFGKKKEWMVSGGIELPQYSITPGIDSKDVTQPIPDIPVSIRYGWNKGNDWVKLSGVLRNLYYRNEAADKNVDVVGYGVELSGTAQLFPRMRGFWTGVYGRGIASYIQDLSGVGLDLTPTTTKTLGAARTWGAFGGFQYDFTKNVYASLTYSHVRNYADEWARRASSEPYGGMYKYAQYALANVFWKVTPIVTTGVEYIYGRRVDNNGGQTHCNRLQTMIQVSF